MLSVLGKDLEFRYLFLLFFFYFLLIVFYFFIFVLYSLIRSAFHSLPFIYLYININLNVSRTCAQWLTGLLSSHALTILKNAAYSAKLKLLICTCFCAHYEWSLSKTSETKNQWPKIFACQLNIQKQQASVAQKIILMTEKRWASVQARGGVEKDA